MTIDTVFPSSTVSFHGDFIGNRNCPSLRRQRATGWSTAARQSRLEFQHQRTHGKRAQIYSTTYHSSQQYTVAIRCLRRHASSARSHVSHNTISAQCRRRPPTPSFISDERFRPPSSSRRVTTSSDKTVLSGFAID